MYCEMLHHESVSTYLPLSSGTISQYLLVRFGAFLVYIISIIDSRYPISFVEKLSTLELGQRVKKIVFCVACKTWSTHRDHDIFVVQASHFGVPFNNF